MNAQIELQGAVPRRVGIGKVRDFRWGTHACVFYDTTEEMFGIGAAFLRAGLEGDELCVWIARPEFVGDAAKHLELEIPGLDRYRALRSIEVLDAQAVHLREGTFHVDEVVNQLRKKLAEGRARGYAGLRVYIDAWWCPWANKSQICAWEESLHQALSEERIIVLCSYPLGPCDAKVVLEIVHIHGVAVAERNGTWEEVESANLRKARAALLDSEERFRHVSDTAIIARKEADQALRDKSEQLQRTNEELNKRSAKLEETIADLEHIAHSIIHDMRAPLRAIHGYITLVERDEATRLSPEGKEFMKRIGRAAEWMDLLVTDSFDYSAVVRKELPLSGVNVGEVLHAILGFYPSFQEPRATIMLDLQLPEVVANKAGLTQCFSNLLDNAVKFVPKGTKPEVRVWAQITDHRGMIRVWFEDNGPGIAEQHRGRIFEMFQRLHGREFEGAGIGLAIVKKLIERMGGHVGVESEAGKGSRFWVELRAA